MGERTVAKHQAAPALSLVLLLWPILAAAQPRDGITQQQLDSAMTFGGIAAVSPICGLRDAAWASDLWRAGLLALGAPPAGAASADPAHRAIADRAGAVLSYAEDEALESFAETPPQTTCGPLAHDPNLARADEMVAAFRAGLGQAVW